MLGEVMIKIIMFSLRLEEDSPACSSVLFIDMEGNFERQISSGCFQGSVSFDLLCLASQGLERWFVTGVAVRMPSKGPRQGKEQ